MSEDADSIYYRHAGRLGLAQRLSRRARLGTFRRFMDEVRPAPDARVLDVGVSLDVRSPEANVLEQFLPRPERLTCAGIGDGESVRAAYPGVHFVQIEPHATLPFTDGEFDVAYSNAVVEHVGSRDRQRAFLAELCRVGRRVFVVAPNRLFPVEHHTALPLVHWLPLPWFRGLLRPTPWRHWAEEENLNPLTAGTLRELFPAPVRVCHAGLGLGPFRSNLVAIR